MRIRTKVNVTASADANGKDKLFALDDALAETVLDGFQELSSGNTLLPATTVFSIPLGGVSTAQGVFIKTTGQLLLSVNGGAGIPIKPGATGPAGEVASSAKVLLEAGITSLQVTVGAADVSLLWCIWGDPEA